MRYRLLGSLIILAGSAGLALSDQPKPSGRAPFLQEIIPVNDERPAPGNDAAPLSTGQFSEPSQASGQFWGSAEFLLWTIRKGNVLPLVTTGSESSAATLGAPGTTVLFGGSLDYDERPGARFTVGGWLNCEHTKGVELSYFFVDGGAEHFMASSSGAAGSAVISRPFFNVISGVQGVQLVALPGIVGGSVSVSSNSTLQGGEMNMLCNLCCRPACPCNPCDFCCTGRSYGYRVDLIAGPRWMQLNEDLTINEQLTDPTATFGVTDRFDTRNNFYGGQIGARAEWQRGPLFVNVLGKIALGDTHQEVRISGSTVITESGMAPTIQQGGLLALPTNIGSYNRDRFSAVPEFGINVGCQLTRRLRVFAGYTFLYWSNVVRPGDQIDVGVNPTQIPSSGGAGTLVGPARPAFAFHESDFWAQGISTGLEFRW